MTTVIVPLSGYLNRKIKGLLSLTKIAKKRSLYFSTEDEVGTNVIAIDARKRKLLYLKKAPNTSSCLIVDLNNLVSCSIRKQYNSIDAGDLNTKKLQDFLKSVFIDLSFKNGTGTLSLPLYDEKNDQECDIEQLEEKAKKWVTIVTRFLPIQIRERA
jgi:hypothetical protein